MSIKIIVNGARGRMGSLAVETLKKQADFNVIAALDHHDDLAANLKKYQPNIVVDFTNATAAYQNAETIIKHNVHPVIGTTGFELAQINALTLLCKDKKLGGLIAPNFSIGAILMMRYATDAAKYFHEVEIIETHHTQKIDAPSGTAKKTAQLIQQVRKQATTVSKNPARGDSQDGVTIHSVRLPGRVAHQQTIFGGVGETLTIQHDCIDREAFMPGVVLACRKVLTLETLVYGLDEVL